MNNKAFRLWASFEIDKSPVRARRVWRSARQGASGLGLEVQRAAVTGCLNGGDWTLGQKPVIVFSDGPVEATVGSLSQSIEERQLVVLPTRNVSRTSWMENEIV
jgi:hypothetical protein